MPRVVRSGRWHQLRWVAAAARAAKVPALVGATAATLIRTTEVQVEEVPTSATGRRADRKATHLKKKNGTNIQTKPWSITVSRASPSRLSTTTKALNLTNWASKRVCCFVSTFFPTNFFRFGLFYGFPAVQRVSTFDCLSLFRWRFREIGGRRRTRMVQRSQRWSSGSLSGQLRRDGRLNMPNA